MFGCLFGHKFIYGHVKEEGSDGVHLRKCLRCNEHWWLKSCQVTAGKLVDPVWIRMGRWPQFTVKPWWFWEMAEFVATIQERDD